MWIATLKRTGALGIVAAWSLGATTVTYTYTGNDFSTVFSPYTQSDYVSVELDFANPLAANLADSDVSGALLNWSMTDQLQSFSSTGNDTLQYAVVSTDGSGNIDQWQLVSCDVLSDCQSSSFTIASYDLNQVVQDSGTTDNGEYGLNTGSQGLWAQTQSQSGATPEPASPVLLSGAILALWAGKRAGVISG